MDYDFRRQEIGDAVRLRLDVGEEIEIDEFALNMMNRNDPNHLIPVQLVQRDSVVYLQYDINDMQSLQNRLAGRLGKKDVIHILNSIIETFEEAEDYMLTEDILVMDMNYVYIDAAEQCRFLCVPCRQKDFDDQILFLRGIVERMLMCYADADTLIYDLLNAYNRDGIKKLSDMKDLLRKLGNSELPANEAGMAAGKDEFVTSENESQMNRIQENTLSGKGTVPPKALSSSEKSAEEKPVERKKALPVGFEIPGQRESVSPVGFQIPGRDDAFFNIPEKKESKKDKNRKEGKKESSQKSGDKETMPKIGIMGKVFRKNDVGEKEVQKEQIFVPGNGSVDVSSDMYESYETTVMVSDMEIPGMELESEVTRMLDSLSLTGLLIRRKTQEHFIICEGESVIGSGSAATCVISGNKAISRLHAIIRIEEDRVSVRDNHSSNGTWVDGKKLIVGNTVFIGHHAVIKLADEEFDFTFNRH